MDKSMKQLQRVAFVGGGMMAEAILKGILASGLLASEDIVVSDISADRLKYLQQTYGVNVTDNSVETVKASRLVILAVKPQVIDVAITAELANTIEKDAFVLSIVGSVNLKKLHGLIPESPIIRAMPNTPLAIGMGMTALVPDEKVTDEMLAVAKAVFEACGEVEVVPESAIEAITAVSGCGPGYVFMLIDALADAGVNAGLSRQMAIKLAAQTFAGSGKMVLETGLHPAQLRDQVTSPGGTTIAGLHALENRGVRAAFYDAVMAVLARSAKLQEK